jgi:hypothetical protein
MRQQVSAFRSPASLNVLVTNVRVRFAEGLVSAQCSMNKYGPVLMVEQTTLISQVTPRDRVLRHKSALVDRFVAADPSQSDK